MREEKSAVRGGHYLRVRDLRVDYREMSPTECHHSTRERSLYRSERLVYVEHCSDSEIDSQDVFVDMKQKRSVITSYSNPSRKRKSSLNHGVSPKRKSVSSSKALHMSPGEMENKNDDSFESYDGHKSDSPKLVFGEEIVQIGHSEDGWTQFSLAKSPLKNPVVLLKKTMETQQHCSESVPPQKCPFIGFTEGDATFSEEKLADYEGFYEKLELMLSKKAFVNKKGIKFVKNREQGKPTEVLGPLCRFYYHSSVLSKVNKSAAMDFGKQRDFTDENGDLKKTDLRLMGHCDGASGEKTTFQEQTQVLRTTEVTLKLVDTKKVAEDESRKTCPTNFEPLPNDLMNEIGRETQGKELELKNQNCGGLQQSKDVEETVLISDDEDIVQPTPPRPERSQLLVLPHPKNLDFSGRSEVLSNEDNEDVQFLGVISPGTKLPYPAVKAGDNICYTSCNNKQERLLYFFAKRFGLEVEFSISKKTKILVTGSPMVRTRKVLEAIVKRCLVVSFDWVEACSQTNKFLAVDNFLPRKHILGRCLDPMNCLPFEGCIVSLPEDSRSYCCPNMIQALLKEGGAQIVASADLMKLESTHGQKLIIYFNEEHFDWNKYQIMHKMSITPVRPEWVHESVYMFKKQPLQKYIHPKFLEFMKTSIE